MQAGKLRHRITIENPQDVRGPTGEELEAWVTLATVSASVEPLSGRELLQAEQLQAEATLMVRIRYLDGLTNESRILHDGRTLEIAAIINPEDRNVELELMCRESV